MHFLYGLRYPSIEKITQGTGVNADCYLEKKRPPAHSNSCNTYLEKNLAVMRFRMLDSVDCSEQTWLRQLFLTESFSLNWKYSRIRISSLDSLTDVPGRRRWYAYCHTTGCTDLSCNSHLAIYNCTPDSATSNRRHRQCPLSASLKTPCIQNCTDSHFRLSSRIFNHFMTYSMSMCDVLPLPPPFSCVLMETGK